jgi:hypothetical protein
LPPALEVIEVEQDEAGGLAVTRDAIELNGGEVVEHHRRPAQIPLAGVRPALQLGQRLPGDARMGLGPHPVDLGHEQRELARTARTCANCANCANCAPTIVVLALSVIRRSALSSRSSQDSGASDSS